MSRVRARTLGAELAVGARSEIEKRFASRI